MSTRATKSELYRLSDEIETLTGIDPIPQNESPEGTEADRRYYWAATELARWFDARQYEMTSIVHATKGTGDTVRALLSLLVDAQRVVIRDLRA